MIPYIACLQTALPATGGSSTSSTVLDLWSAANGYAIRPAMIRVGFDIEVPLAGIKSLPAGQTLTLTVESSDNPSSGFTTLNSFTITGPVDPNAIKVFGDVIPTTCKRYFRITAASSASAGNLSAGSAAIFLGAPEQRFGGNGGLAQVTP